MEWKRKLRAHIWRYMHEICWLLQHSYLSTEIIIMLDVKWIIYCTWKLLAAIFYWNTLQESQMSRQRYNDNSVFNWLHCALSTVGSVVSSNWLPCKYPQVIVMCIKCKIIMFIFQRKCISSLFPAVQCWFPWWKVAHNGAMHRPQCH